jgi:tetratricopeptide (TPR) repeat protein
VALSDVSSVGHFSEKLKRLTLHIWFLATALFFSSLNAETVSEVASLIKEGKMEKARSLTKAWGDETSLSDAQLFLKAIVTVRASRAAALYETLINRFPESSYSDDALFRLGQWRYADGLYLTARQEFRKLIKDYPRSQLVEKSRYWIGLSFQAAGEVDSARSFLGEIIADESRSETDALTGNRQESLENQVPTESRPSPPPPQKPKIMYAIQVGAFTKQNGALMRKAFFEREGFDVNLRTKKKDDTLFYLVWVGSFDNAEDARALGVRLNQKYGISYTLVSE